MNNPSQQKKKRKLSRLFWAGLILFVIGTGPLLVIIALAAMGITRDPNPNPVGFGILAMFTFWPSIGLIIAGLVVTFFKKNN